jgi:hypothetical protein
LVIILLGSAAGRAAVADQTGFAEMHAQARVGNKVCMTEHSHQGGSDGKATRKVAEVEAIRNWSSFTDFEYGSDWASFSLAVGKTMSCENNGGWSCSVDARPCRLAGRQTAKARR